MRRKHFGNCWSERSAFEAGRALRARRFEDCEPRLTDQFKFRAEVIRASSSGSRNALADLSK
jgi:hypothetical protein